MTDDPARLSYAEFQRVDVRVGRVIAIEDFPAARKTVLQAADRFRPRHRREEIVSAPSISQVLTLGVPDGDGDVVLLLPERDVPIHGRMF